MVWLKLPSGLNGEVHGLEVPHCCSVPALKRGTFQRRSHSVVFRKAKGLPCPRGGSCLLASRWLRGAPAGTVAALAKHSSVSLLQLLSPWPGAGTTQGWTATGPSAAEVHRGLEGKGNQFRGREERVGCSH